MNPATAIPSIFDTSGLAAIKRQAKGNDPAALKAAAQQFEALFLHMVLKSMRDATPREGLFDSEQTRLYETLLDQQMAQVMAAKGGAGLAKVIESQLSRQTSIDTAVPESGLPFDPPAQPLPLSPATTPKPLSAVEGSVPATPREFVAKVWPHAAEASRDTGIPARFLVAQAALETGWGRAEPRRADGGPSYNVFGIKAGRNWNGPTVEASTTEYVDGVARQQVERFRAYGSYAEAFRDYAGLLAANPRYAAVMGSADAASFAQRLQRAGYATDPAYADKLTRVIDSLSRTTLAG